MHAFSGLGFAVEPLAAEMGGKKLCTLGDCSEKVSYTRMLAFVFARRPLLNHPCKMHVKDVVLHMYVRSASQRKYARRTERSVCIARG
jgi:hypothetical protein